MLFKETWMEIRQLYQQGLSLSEIARQLKIDRKTVRKYAQHIIQPSYPKRPAIRSLLDPYKDYLENRLAQYDLSAHRLFQEIKQQGYSGCYSGLAASISQIKKDYRQQAVLRFETLPGEQAQVDWGYLGEIYDQDKRSFIKLYCFFMILGYSRMLYAEVFETMKFENFLKGHNDAFLYFGGYSREILYDNLKSVVIKRTLLAKDSDFNKKFMDFSGYYGFKPILCRPYKPNTKGKIEKSVDYVKQNFYLGRSFLSLHDINQQLKMWLEEANSRLHYTTHERPLDRLKRETLIRLAHKTLYDLTPFYWRKVSRDCFFSYGGNFYSVPHFYAGKEITLRFDGNEIEIFYRKNKIAQHALIKGKGQFIRNENHFEGLLEIRCRHRLKKPKKAKPSIPSIPIKPVSYSHTWVIQPDLSHYEEVI